MATSTVLGAPRQTEHDRGGGPRRILGVVLAGIGALIFVVGGLVHFYVVPALSIAPIDQNSVTRLEAKGATVFDTDTLKPITTDLSISAKTTGDVAASDKAGGDTRVWVNSTTITSADGTIRSQSVERAAFNGRTAEAVNCCSNWMESDQGVRQAVKRTGLIYKFPFNTEKKTYQVWDNTANRAVDTRYTGTSRVLGTKVYVFKADVPATVVGSQVVPASVMGLAGDGNVTADSNYQNAMTYYIEPTTGAIVNEVQDTKAWFSFSGHDLVTTQARVQYTQAQIKDMIDHTLGNQPALLRLAQGYLPWLAAVLGLVLIAVGGAFVRRHHD